MLFVGDDWAEDHHDVEIVDSDGKRLGRARLPEGMTGMTRLHALIAEHLDEADLDSDTGMLAAGRVVVGIETDRGPWVAALLVAGYQVFAINPMSAARYRERHTTSGAKSDPGDAHVLAEIVPLDREHHRPVAGNSGEVEGLKLIAHAPEPDLGPDPAAATPAPGAARVLPRPARGPGRGQAGARRSGRLVAPVRAQRPARRRAQASSPSCDIRQFRSARLLRPPPRRGVGHGLRCANSRTVWSGICTAAGPQAGATRRTPPGPAPPTWRPA